MSFNLFGFDFFRQDSLYGFWIIMLNDCNDHFNRSLFCIYWAEGSLSLDILFFRFFLR